MTIEYYVFDTEDEFVNGSHSIVKKSYEISDNIWGLSVKTFDYTEDIFNILELPPGLEYLNLTRVNLKDINVVNLDRFYCLKHLYLNSNSLTNCKALKNLITLQSLHLAHNYVTDINDLANLINLQVLVLINNHIIDISSLGGLTNLTELHIEHNHIIDISSLGRLTKLKKLRINKNKIVDINCLNTLTKLRELVISDNKITDMSVTHKLPKLSICSTRGNPIYISPRVEDLDIAYVTEHAVCCGDVNDGYVAVWYYYPSNGINDKKVIIIKMPVG